MSYDIVYDRVFIKSPMGYTPLLLIGNSHVTTCENGRWVIAKDWSVWGNAPCYTEQALRQMVEKICNQPCQEFFKRNGKWVDSNGLRRFVNDGIKQAWTIEEIRAVAPYISLQCDLHIYTPTGRKRDQLNYIETTDELVQWMQYAIQRADQRTEDESIYYVMTFGVTKELKLPPKNAIKGPISLRGRYGYVTYIDQNSIKFSSDPKDAAVYENVAAVSSLLKHSIDRVRVVKASSTANRRTI